MALLAGASTNDYGSIARHKKTTASGHLAGHAPDGGATPEFDRARIFGSYRDHLEEVREAWETKKQDMNL